MDKVEKKSLIKSLLSGKLTKKQRREFADLEPVDIEIRKQWNESGNGLVNVEIKEQIWKKLKNRCEYKERNQVLVELRWYCRSFISSFVNDRCILDEFKRKKSTR